MTPPVLHWPSSVDAAPVSAWPEAAATEDVYGRAMAVSLLPAAFCLHGLQ